jgi:C1A family cysteine protease
MKAVFALSAVALSNATISYDVITAFSAFTQKFGKTYTDTEWTKRLAVFADNIDKVNKDNAEHMLVAGTAVFGVTKFMDLTAEEFKATYLTYIPSNHTVPRTAITLDGPMAASIDWRTKGAVTPVKDQGQCGSCWAFSATEAIESYNFLKTGELHTLSPQQINSCDKVDQGCNGGNTESAYAYVKEAGGIESESSYPYTSGGGNTGNCKFKRSDVAVSISGYTSIESGETSLQSALNHGPASVCVAAEAFQTYTGGILKVCRGQIDHCVQAVGYDAEDKYWLVRNSWATSWGERGYIRLEMGKDLCHIADDATYPTF